MALESPVWPLPGPRTLLADFSPTHAANALVAFLFAVTGPIAIILAVGAKGGLGEAELASWIFGAIFLNSLITIVFCLIYRQPLVFFWSITGAVVVAPAFGHLSFGEIVGAYYVTGLLVLILGLSGWARRSMEALPMPIVMAMVAGVFLQFGLDWIFAFSDGFWIALPMTVAFFGLTAAPALARRFPPLIAAMAVGTIAVWALGAFEPGANLSLTLVAPVIQTPVFSWPAMVELVIPLTITVLVVQNGQGAAILKAAGHQAPMNSVAVACGLGGFASAAVGAVPTALTGPVNAIITSSGSRHGQYTAGVAIGVMALGFGLYAPFFTRLLLATPGAFIATLAGIAMLRVLQNAFVASFQGRFTLGALVTFGITISDISLFGIGAAFWGLVFGVLASLILERDDFRGLSPAPADG